MSYLFSLKMPPSPTKKKKNPKLKSTKMSPSFNFSKFIQASVRELFVLDAWTRPIYFH